MDAISELILTMQFSAPQAFNKEVCLSSPTLSGTTETRGTPKLSAKAVPWKLDVTTRLALAKRLIPHSVHLFGSSM